jgi:asparagine N-glycosylation enzyme membrane subunit Stt3
MENKKIELMKKYLLKNNYVLIFSVLSFLAICFFMAGVFKIRLGNNFLGQTLSILPIEIWFLLFLSLAVSSILAYYEKYKFLVLPVFIWLLIFTIQFRTSNIPQLIDITTKEYTLGPDLDPFLYLRLAKDIDQGKLPIIDSMRSAPLGAPNYARASLMPWSIVWSYKLISMFTNISITYAAIILPVILFIISLIGFFLFVKTIFSFHIDKPKASIIALIASIFYAFSPQMLHRTTAGIPEIESLGMAFFWFSFLFFSLAWKNEKKSKLIGYGIIAGIFTGLMSWSWGGYKYIYMIFSLTTFILFFLGKDYKKTTLIYSSWLIPALIIEFFKVKSMSAIINSLPSTGFALAIFFLLILQIIFLKLKLGEKFKKIILPEPLKIILLGIILGIIGILIINPKLILTIFSQVTEGLLYPFGRGRTGLTVAENQVPFLTDALQQFSYLFWAFLISNVYLFYESVKHFDKKHKITLTLSFVIFISCLTFSRISSSSILNGDSFFSKFIFFMGFIIFIFLISKVYIQAHKNKDEKTLEDFKTINISYVLLIAFSFWAILSVRGAIRLFFIVSPMIILTASSLPIKIFELKKKIKDDASKIFLVLILILVIFSFAFLLLQHSYSTINEAKNTVPGVYENQWQKAMEWARTNTSEGSIFVHWWDYGYWIQSIGNRPTVTDGGHNIAYWNHLTGRYLLTTPYPETAFSLMKSYNVSYLLIDSTDIGKYSAYSKIGSDISGEDRFSWITTMVSDPKNTQETSNGTIRIYQGATVIDKDIVYSLDGKEIFLPAYKAAIVGVILESIEKNGSVSFSNPKAVFNYNGNQIEIPIRYLYYNQQIVDFKGGLEVAISIIPRIYQTTQGYQIDPLGALIYLSPKTFNSLVGQLFILEDVFGKYNELKIAHTEEDPLLAGSGLKGFIYFNGIRGPIKIWKVNYPENITIREEFLRKEGSYAEFDNLTFTK